MTVYRIADIYIYIYIYIYISAALYECPRSFSQKTCDM